MAWTLLLLVGALQRAPQAADVSRAIVGTTTTIASLLAADSALAADASRRGAAAVLDAFEPDAAMLFSGQPIIRADSGRAAFLARYGAPSAYRWHTSPQLAPGLGGLPLQTTWPSAKRGRRLAKPLLGAER